MKLTVLWGFLAVFFTCAQADETTCSKQNCEEHKIVETKKMALNYLDSIDFKVPGQLFLQQGRKNEYYFKGSQEALTHIKVHIHPGGDLVVEPREMDVGSKNTSSLMVYVTVKDLQKLNLGRSTKTAIKGLKVKKLVIEADDQSMVKGDLIVDQLLVEMKGNSNIAFKGSAFRQNVEIRGNGIYLAPKLTSRKAELNIHGNGEASVRATQELSVVIVGDAKVFYSGNPQVINDKVTGSGVIRKIKG